MRVSSIRHVRQRAYARAAGPPAIAAALAVAAAMALAMWLLAAAAPARAQTVQKCIAADGHVSFTSGACGAGERLDATYAAVPERVTAGPAAAATARRAAEPGARRRGQQARPPARAPRSQARPTRAAPDRCQAARDRRERTLARVGLKRTFDLLRKLDDEVWAACR